MELAQDQIARLFNRQVLNGYWIGRWREDVVQPDGSIKRKLRYKRLVEVSDKYRYESDVRPIFDELLLPVNSGRVDARSTTPIAQFIDEHYLPFSEENHKPSTYDGYKKLWKSLKPRLDPSKELREYRTVDCANLLTELANKGLGKRTLQHIKSFLSGVFTYAKNIGAIDGVNPVRDAMIPKKAKRPTETSATSPEEVSAMLKVFEDAAKKEADEDERKKLLQARAAIALTYFGGLRPGEARGARWEDYDGKRLQVRQSVWRKHVTDPKTESSQKPIPIIEPLRSILSDLRKADGDPKSGWILKGSKGKPLNLDNLSRRVIKPELTRCEVCGVAEYKHAKENAENEHEFKLDSTLPRLKGGYYPQRRGLGTITTSITGNALAAKEMLRHSNIAVTQAHYLKDVPQAAIDVMNAVEQLFAQPTTEAKQ